MSDDQDGQPVADVAPPEWTLIVERWFKRGLIALALALAVFLYYEAATRYLPPPIAVILSTLLLVRATQIVFRHLALLFLASVVIPAAWLLAIGDHTVTANRVALTLMVVAWAACLPWIHGWISAPRIPALSTPLPVARRWQLAVQACLLAWIALSFLQPFTQPSPRPAQTSAQFIEQTGKPQIGLALSGGGYRAGLLQAGVVDALETIGLRPTHISSVSGGSIFASYYLTGGRPADFVQFVADGRFKLAHRLTYANVSIPLLLGWLSPDLPHARTRSDFQEEVINRAFLRNRTLNQISDPRAAHWIIGATEWRLGWGVGITRAGLLFNPNLKASERIQFRNAPVRPQQDRTCLLETAPDSDILSAPLSRLIVGSGAFPLAFNAVPLRNGQTQLELVDGGVSDNTGLRLLLGAHYAASAPALSGECSEMRSKLRVALEQTSPVSLADWKLDLVISADGGLPVQRATRVSLPAQLGQAIDTVYANVGFPSGLASGVPAILLHPADLADYDFPESPCPAFATGVSPEEMVRRVAMGGGDRRLRVLRQVRAMDERALALFESLRPQLEADTWRACGADLTRTIADQRLEMLVGLLNNESQAPYPKDFYRVATDTLGAFDVYLDSFLRTGTLEDSIDVTRALHIYRLGQLLVALTAF